MYYQRRKKSVWPYVFLILAFIVLSGLVFLGIWTQDIPQATVEKEIPHDQIFTE